MNIPVHTRTYKPSSPNPIYHYNISTIILLKYSNVNEFYIVHNVSI